VADSDSAASAGVVRCVDDGGGADKGGEQ